MRRDHPGWRTRGIGIEPAGLAKSIGILITLDPSEGFPQALQQVVEAAKLLFEADGAGFMLVGKDELLTWATQRLGPPGRAGRGRAGGARGRALHGCLAAAEPSAVRDVEAVSAGADDGRPGDRC